MQPHPPNSCTKAISGNPETSTSCSTPLADDKIDNPANLSNEYYAMVVESYQRNFPQATKHSTNPVSKRNRQAIDRAIINFKEWTDYPFSITNLDIIWENYAANNPAMGMPYKTKNGNYNNNTICTFLTETAIQDAFDNKNLGD